MLLMLLLQAGLLSPVSTHPAVSAPKTNQIQDTSYTASSVAPINNYFTQSEPTPSSPPYAAIGVVVAAVVAAIVSWLVSFNASKTTRETAEMAARTAREIKDTDFRHDFYKKVIEKRLKSCEEAQELVTMLRQELPIAEGGPLHRYCSSGENFSQAMKRMDQLVISQIIWMSKKYMDEFKEFYELNSLIQNTVTYKRTSENGIGIDEDLLWKAAKQEHEVLAEKVMEMAALLTDEIKAIPEVEEFLAKPLPNN